MPRLIHIIIASLLLTACSSDLKDAEQILTDSLPIPKGVEFKGMVSHPGGVVCGEYSAYESHVSPKSEFKPFMTVRGELNNPPDELDQTVYCTDDPAQALLQETGIGLFDANNKNLAKIAADFSALADALESYYKDNNFYPRMEHGLEALAKPVASRGRPVKEKGNGYLNEIPTDPWGRPYVYFEEQWGRVKGYYLITTLGASGTKGGSGENMDVTTAHLPYLRHIAIVLGER